MINLEQYIKNPSVGYVVKIFNNDKELTYVIGNRSVLPKVIPTTLDTLYDIASLTKTYTAVLVYMAYEEKLLDIYDTVYNVDNNFKNLKDVRIIDLLSHNQEIWTDGYLGNSKTKEEFYKILYSSSVKSKIPTYVDAHYIILSTILEKLYNTDFKNLVNEKIIKKLNLKNTTFSPDENKTASNNFECTSDKIVDNIYPGVIHDTKARVAKQLGITTGHASIFTTCDDLLIFLKTFFDYSLLKKETIDLMLQHNDINLSNYNILKQYSNKSDINEMYEDTISKNPDLYLPKTYNNMGTRYRNDINILNDVPTKASDNSISFSGYTGPMFTIDFERKIIVVIMCNVIHNTRLNRIERKNKVVDIMNYIFKQL